jgi:acetyl-CoA carboxylase biotin carboxylase subunit
VRVDSGVFGGFTVPPNYDSLLGKVIVHAPTREQALARMQRALDEFIIGGIRTNIPLHKELLDLPDVLAGTMTTRTVENFMAARKSSS